MAHQQSIVVWDNAGSELKIGDCVMAHNGHSLTAGRIYRISSSQILMAVTEKPHHYPPKFFKRHYGANLYPHRGLGVHITDAIKITEEQYNKWLSLQ